MIDHRLIRLLPLQVKTLTVFASANLHRSKSINIFRCFQHKQVCSLRKCLFFLPSRNKDGIFDSLRIS